MDSVICLWEPKVVKCDHFLSHKGSISKITSKNGIGISSSYDCTLIIWDLNYKRDAKQLIGPHK